MSYFAIERDQKYWDHIVIKDNDGNDKDVTLQVNNQMN